MLATILMEDDAPAEAASSKFRSFLLKLQTFGKLGISQCRTQDFPWAGTGPRGVGRVGGINFPWDRFFQICLSQNEMGSVDPLTQVTGNVLVGFK